MFWYVLLFFPLTSYLFFVSLLLFLKLFSRLSVQLHVPFLILCVSLVSSTSPYSYFLPCTNFYVCLQLHRYHHLRYPDRMPMIIIRLIGNTWPSPICTAQFIPLAQHFLNAIQQRSQTLVETATESTKEKA